MCEDATIEDQDHTAKDLNQSPKMNSRKSSQQETPAATTRFTKRQKTKGVIDKCTEKRRNES
jgi:hypothetical protein